MCRKQNCLLLVGKVKSWRVGSPPPFGSRADWSASASLAAAFTIGRRSAYRHSECLPIRDRNQAVQHQVHQCQAVRVLDMLHAVKGGAAMLALLPLPHQGRCAGANSDPPRSKPRCPPQDPWMTSSSVGRITATMQSISGRGVNTDRPELFHLAFAVQQPFIRTGRPDPLSRAVPVQLVDLADQRRQRRRLFDRSCWRCQDLF